MLTILCKGIIHSCATEFLDSVHRLKYGIEGDIAINGFLPVCGCVLMCGWVCNFWVRVNVWGCVQCVCVYVNVWVCVNV
jgi:hypothetical protein